MVLIVFNRPELTARVFARIREAKPEKLFVVADGPRPDRPGEAEKCRRVREVIEQGVDWPCEVIRDYSEVNLGSGRRVASGISKAFESVEMAIILEDDCLPDPTFFRFCAELLERYRDEPLIGLIGGAPHVDGMVEGANSYYFCRYGYTWGWATWRRAWNRFDYSMRGWADWRDSGGMERMFATPAVREYWRRVWDNAAQAHDDIWDFQWVYCYMRAGMLGILPRVALVENVGFGDDATHTRTVEWVERRAESISFPLQHPNEIIPDYAAEAAASARFFTHRPLWMRLYNRLSNFYRIEVKGKIMYKAKVAYTGDVALRYDEDRRNEPLWDLEQTIVHDWVEELPGGAAILDVPVGTGRFLPFYRERQLFVRGIDVSPDMIVEAQRRHAPLPPHIVLSVGDAENLHQPDKSADYVICWRLAHLLPLPVLKSVLMEFRRVTRREVLLQVLAMAPEVAARKPCWRALIRPLRQLGLRIFPHAPTPWSHITSYAHKESEVVSMAVELGFDVVGRIDLGVYHGHPSAAFRLKVA